MSDTTGPDSVETTVNEPIVPEPLELADQSPVQTTVPAAPAKKSSTRTILEVVGGVVAVGLIIVSGVVGFAVGHFTSSGDDRGRGISSHADGQFGQGQGFGEGRGQNMMPGQGQDMMPGQGQQGLDPRGIDPDGDNWMGGGQNMMPGQGQDMMPGQGPQGMDPRGIDPDGDNWTGGGQGIAPIAPQSDSSASPSAGA